MRPTRVRSLAATVAVAVMAAMLSLIGASTASAAPRFEMPFPCGQLWAANNAGSSAHKGKELDFNRGTTATADRGDTVVATAAGTVRSAGHQGSTNGYGNLVTIDHGSGWVSYYAHLSTIAVKRGEAVLQGQPIGSVGNTSKPGNNISPHLHYELRQGSGYPGNIRSVPGFNYAAGGTQAIRSNNCATKRDPVELCGSDYVVNDSAKLGSAGAVVLTWSAGARKNCAVTLKFGKLGTRSSTSVFITPSGGSRASDAGNFLEYAGPVRTKSPSCIRWGGAIGGSSYTSPSEHC